MRKLPWRGIVTALLILLPALLAGALFYAAQREEASMIVMQSLLTGSAKALAGALAHGGNPNATDRFGDTPPTSAAGWLRQMLHPKYGYGESALVITIMEQRPDLMLLLLNHGADPGGEGSALPAAIELEQPALVQLLLARGANPRLPDVNGHFPVQEVCRDWPDTEVGATQEDRKEIKQREAALKTILRMLVAHGESVTVPLSAADDMMPQPLAGAVHGDQPGLARLLLQDGANPNATTMNGFSLLQTVTDNGFGGNPRMVHLLLQYGANPNTSIIGGDTLLNCAWGGMHGDAVIQLLLQYGANPNRMGDTTSPLLVSAAAQSNTPIVQALLAHGANPNVTDGYKETALIADAKKELEDDYARHHNTVYPDQLPHWRFQWPHGKPVPTATAAALLAHGADPNKTDQEGMTALDYARASGKTALVNLLRAHGARG